MSHEVRNPLSGVLMLSELVLDGPLTEEKRPELEMLYQSANSVQAIFPSPGPQSRGNFFGGERRNCTYGVLLTAHFVQTRTAVSITPRPWRPTISR
jgi:hypothetical protein